MKLFFPNLEDLRRGFWVKGHWDHDMCSLLLGRSPLAGDHWYFAPQAKLDCVCGHHVESTAHFLFDCPLWLNYRHILSVDELWPLDKKCRVVGRNLGKLRDFIKATGRFDSKNVVCKQIKERFKPFFKAKLRRRVNYDRLLT